MDKKTICLVVGYHNEDVICEKLSLNYFNVSYTCGCDANPENEC